VIRDDFRPAFRWVLPLAVLLAVILPPEMIPSWKQTLLYTGIMLLCIAVFGGILYLGASLYLAITRSRERRQKELERS
jgi:hypothetical protein